MDHGPGKTVGIDLDQATGNMSVAWSADQSTLSWLAGWLAGWLVLIDDDANRVLVGTNISSNITNPLDLQVGPKGANYIEQISGVMPRLANYLQPLISLAL